MKMQNVLLMAVAVSTMFTMSGCGGGSSGPDTTTPIVQPEPGPQPEPEPEPTVDRLPFPFREWQCDPSLAHIPGACGFDGPVDRPHYGTWALPDQAIADAKRMPIYHDHDGNDRRMFVGIDQGTEHIGALAVVGSRGRTEIRFGRLNDGVGRAQVVSYLSQANPSAGIPSNNVVRVIGNASQQDQNRIIAAVRLVNAALPEEFKLHVESPLPSLSLQHGVSGRTYFRTGDELADTIHVEFVANNPDPSSTAAARAWNLLDHALINFFRDSNSYQDERQTTILLAHELMHSLGLSGHPSSSFDTILEGTNQIHATSQGNLAHPMSLLYPIDREALQALYGPLQDGNGISNFGQWSSTSTHLHANSEHVGYGVALRNGYAEPWAYGYLHGYGLADNNALSGDVTWNGHLLGFTPSSEAVVGDAEIMISLSSMTGSADFTALESWSAGTAPGAAGTGTMWLDGDLGYEISVRKNTFRETGGDDGRLTGIFTGQSHEGAAGTLERSDLTAAFGAERE